MNSTFYSTLIGARQRADKIFRGFIKIGARQRAEKDFLVVLVFYLGKSRKSARVSAPRNSFEV